MRLHKRIQRWLRKIFIEPAERRAEERAELMREIGRADKVQPGLDAKKLGGASLSSIEMDGVEVYRNPDKKDGAQTLSIYDDAFIGLPEIGAHGRKVDVLFTEINGGQIGVNGVGVPCDYLVYSDISREQFSEIEGILNYFLVGTHGACVGIHIDPRYEHETVLYRIMTI